jgi:hypothetical protein
MLYRLALEAGVINVEEELKPRIKRSQLARWAAYYRVEPWGNPWRRAGRATALIRAALGCRYDKGDEERFLPSYREGDESRPAVPQTDEEIAAALAALPGLKRERTWRTSARYAQYSRPRRAVSSRV